MCHEFGHSLGIGHIQAGNLMAPYYSARIGTPQSGDIAEMVARYGANVPTPPPTEPTTPTEPPTETESILVRIPKSWVVG